MRMLLAVTLAAAVCLPGCGGAYKTTKTDDTAKPAGATASAGAAAQAATPSSSALPRVKVETDMGTMVFELWPDKAPKSVANFLTLVGQGFYDGILFHRIERGFVIQGGDPNTKGPNVAGWGQGGPGYQFEDEPVKGEYVKYTLAMANAGPNTNGSQFFICTGDLTGRLPKQYNLFGRVVEGMPVVDAMDALETRAMPGGLHMPVKPPKIVKMAQL
jgi:cyclophilin family peptidyl-prolyl cis-trans isomerase